MIKVYLFAPKSDIHQPFNHVWNNDGMDFFDTVHQDKTYDAEGKLTKVEEVEYSSLGYENAIEGWLAEHYEDWGWTEIPNTRLQKSNISYFKIQVEASEIVSPTLFIKLIDYDETTEKQNGVPLYFYSTRITESSDQSLSRISYTCEFELDKWSTYWAEMHRITKEVDWEDIDAKNKMCDRFVFLKKYGYYVDYFKCPWLMRNGNYDGTMVRDDTEKFLTLEEWAYLNSNDYVLKTMKEWIIETWNPWFNNQFFGAFDPMMKIADEKDPWKANKSILWDGARVTNEYYWVDSNNAKFNDSNFNSKGKYKWLIARTGNNTYNELTSSTVKDKSGNVTSTSKSKSQAGSVFKTDYVQSVSPTLVNILESKTWTPRGQFTKLENPEIWVHQWELVNADTYEMTASVGNTYSLTCKSTCPNILITLREANSGELEQVFVSGKLTASYNVTSETKKLEQWLDVFTTESMTITSKEYSDIGYPFTLTLQYKFDSTGTKVSFRFLITVEGSDIAEEILENLQFSIEYDSAEQLPQVHLPFIYNADYGNLTENTHWFNGEELMYLPVPKGEEGRALIRLLNNYYKLDASHPENTEWYLKWGPHNVLNMIINDIPPAIMALALNNKADSSTNAIACQGIKVGDEVIKNPFGIAAMKLDPEDKGTVYYNSMVMMVTENDHVPVKIALSPRHENVKEILGGTNFWNYFYELMTDDDLTMEQTIMSEPFVFAPHFLKWSYFITPNNVLELTAEKIDFYKMLTTDWSINLNVNFAGQSNYKLDFNDVKYEDYPMTKSGMEFISSDQTAFPYSTEMMNAYIETNAASLQYGRDMRKAANDYAKSNKWIESGMSVGLSPVEGFLSGMQSGAGFLGGKLGAVAGGIKGITDIASGVPLLKRRQKFDWAQWQRGIDQQLENTSNSPAQLNPAGFSSGSLLYSNNGEAKQNSYELFRTYQALKLTREQACCDVWMNGYPFASQCMYKEYNNRVNFNIVDMNLKKKEAIFTAYIQNRMLEYSTFFANKEYIEEFIDRCGESMRLFKCKFDFNSNTSLNEIVRTNIELNRIGKHAFYPMGLVKIVKTPHSQSLTIDGTKIKNGVLSGSGEDVIFEITDTPITFDISYFDISEGITSRDDLLDLYEEFTLCKTGTRTNFNCITDVDNINEALYETPVTLTKGVYSYNYEVYDLEDTDGTSRDKSATNKKRLNYSNFIVLHNDKNNNKTLDTLSVLCSDKFQLVNKINVELNDNKITFTLTPVYRWTLFNKYDEIYASIDDWEVAYDKTITKDEVKSVTITPNSKNILLAGSGGQSGWFDHWVKSVRSYNIKSYNYKDILFNDWNWTFQGNKPGSSAHYSLINNFANTFKGGTVLEHKDIEFYDYSAGITILNDASGIIGINKSSNTNLEFELDRPKYTIKDKGQEVGEHISTLKTPTTPWASKNKAGATFGNIYSGNISMLNNKDKISIIPWYIESVQWTELFAITAYIRDYGYNQYHGDFKFGKFKFELMGKINDKLPEINVKNILKSIIFVKRLEDEESTNLLSTKWAK